MKIAVEGCAHGELDKIYEAVGHLEKENNMKVDLLIICGDFQAVRNRSDLVCMAVPPKYQKLNTFYKYYSGEKKAPVLTIFVGGNHEASNYLSELPYGGWVCPNIFYMGYANVININGVRIAGLSGIYKGQDFLKGHFEVLPYDESSKRSVYHIRNVDVFRLKQIKKPIDIFLSHDWPRGVCDFGDKEGLLRFKPFFKDDMESNKLGSRPGEELLHHICPSFWFAAHLHCRFAALIPHENKGMRKYTKFLALDKCLPRRKFLQILDIGAQCNNNAELQIEYDSEWLAILRSTNHLLNVSRNQSYMPGPGCSERWDFSATEEEVDEVQKLFTNDLKIPQNFVQTAPPHSESEQSLNIGPTIHLNPQTAAFCKILGIDDPLAVIVHGSPTKLNVKEYSFIEDANVTNKSELSFNPDDSTIADNSSSSDDASVECHSSDLDTTSSSGFFYIDTRPNHLLTSSPQPSRLSFEERFAMLNERSSDLNATSNNKLFEHFPEFKEQDESEKSEEPQPMSDENPEASPIRTIKRRNLALYLDYDKDAE